MKTYSFSFEPNFSRIRDRNGFVYPIPTLGTGSWSQPRPGSGSPFFHPPPLPTPLQWFIAFCIPFRLGCPPLFFFLSGTGCFDLIFLAFLTSSDGFLSHWAQVPLLGVTLFFSSCRCCDGRKVSGLRPDYARTDGRTFYQYCNVFPNNDVTCSATLLQSEVPGPCSHHSIDMNWKKSQKPHRNYDFPESLLDERWAERNGDDCWYNFVVLYWWRSFGSSDCKIECRILLLINKFSSVVSFKALSFRRKLATYFTSSSSL